MLITTNCSSPERLPGFDVTGWKNDKKGCEGTRSTLVESLIQRKDEIIGLKELAMRDLLGSPDRHELYVRSQKFFIYNVSPDSTCTNRANDSSKSYLSIRFDALGRAREIVLYR